MTAVDIRHLSPRAKRALIGLKAEFEQKLKARKMLYLPPGVLAPLSDEYEARLKAIVREGMAVTRNDRPVRVKCPRCGRRETIAGDVIRWACHCSPRVERMAFQTYEEE